MRVMTNITLSLWNIRQKAVLQYGLILKNSNRFIHFVLLSNLPPCSYLETHIIGEPNYKANTIL